MKTKIKKGTKVICPIYGNDVATVDYINPDGTVELRYKGSKGRWSASTEDLVKVK